MFLNYSTPESNRVNNFLRLLDQIYDRDPKIALEFISHCINDYKDTKGLETQAQHEQGKFLQSGHLIQPGLKLTVMTDAGSQLDVQKLKSDIRALDVPKYEKNCVLLITVREYDLSPEDFQDCNVHFAYETFESLCRHKLCDLCSQEMNDIVSEYVQYCLEDGLIDGLRHYIRIVDNTNIEPMRIFGIYHEPVECGFSSHGYIGFCLERNMKFLYKIDSIVRVSLECEKHELENQSLVAQTVVLKHDAESIGDERELKRKLAAYISERWKSDQIDLRHGYRFYYGQPYEVPSNSNTRCLHLLNTCYLRSTHDRPFLDLRIAFEGDIDSLSPQQIAMGQNFRYGRT